MFASKIFKPLSLILLIFALLLTLWGCRPWRNHKYFQEIRIAEHLSSLKLESTESRDSPELDLGSLQKDPILNLLGKSFAEIKEVLGKPDKEGFSSSYGTQYYMLFNDKQGTILFYSPENPENKENKLAVSIILGKGQTVLGAEVGMTFAEIKKVLGNPSFGPEPGMDGINYMDYYLGEKSNQAPEVFISFAAKDINHPSHDAYIKWEAYE